jgi:ligand-binding sensor domain-containing protein
MISSRHTLLALALLFIKQSDSQVMQPEFNLVRGTNDYLLGKVNGIAQDRFGYMWFADNSNGCLVRYDGYRMKIFSHNPADTNSLNKSPLECITSDPSGDIWIATWSGADKFDPSTNRFIHYDCLTGETKPFTSCILIDHLGYLWLGTDAGVVGLNPRTRKITIYSHRDNDPTSLSCNMVRSLYEDKAGVLWVGTGMAFEVQSKCGGLNKFDRNTGQFTRYLHDPNDPHSLASNKVRAMFEDSKGIFWVGTDGDGLHIMDRNAGTFTRLSYDPRQPGKLSRPPVKKEYPFDHITFITEDISGKIWIGTYSEGIESYDPARKIILRFVGPDKERSKGFTDEHAWCAYTSRDGTLWISTDNGNLFTVDPLQTGFRAVSFSVNMELALGHSVGSNSWRNSLEDQAGNWWTTGATSSNVYGDNRTRLTMINPKTKEKKIFLHRASDPHSLTDNNLTCLSLGSDGRVWVGTVNGINVFDLQTNKFTRYFYNSKTHGNEVRILDRSTYKDDTAVYSFFDTKKETYFGTSKGLFVLNHSSGKFSHYANDPADSASLSIGWGVCDFLEKGDGNIWMRVFQEEANGGAALELFNTKTKKFRHYLKGKEINNIFKSSDGRIWATTRGGLYYENDSLNTFSLAGDWNSQFRNARFRSITEDDDGNIWGVSSLGIFRLNLHKNELCLYANKFGIYDVKLDYQLSAKISTGELIFGNPHGGYYGCFPHDVINPLPPQLHLTDLKIDGHSVNPFAKNDVLKGPIETARVINLRHNQNIFSLDFDAIHFSDPANNVLQYKLDGYENAWLNVGMEKTAYYFNIPPDHYVFRVKASSSYGLNSELAVDIIIHPPWWQTWWFRIIAIASFVVVLYVLVRWWLGRKFKLKLERSEKERQLAALSQKTTELEMQALRAQMNPHFIFNSLNSINMFILENNKLQASDYLSKFSRLVRLILQNSQEASIPLEREVEALKLYLELESLRFDNKFEFKISVGDDVDTTLLRVPPLIIQPYAENAIWHGLMHKKEKGHLEIELYQQEDVLICKVIDDGVGRTGAEQLENKSANKHKSMGIKITESRIAMTQVNGNAQLVEIKDLVYPDGHAAGTEVILKIPVNSILT